MTLGLSHLLNITLTQQELSSLERNSELSDHLSFSQMCAVKFYSTKSTQPLKLKLTIAQDVTKTWL